MGRLIDADFILNKMRTTDAQPITYSEHYAWDFATALLNIAPTVEAIPKDEYENRLKADLVAMLTEMQLEIEELETGGDVWELAIKDNCKNIIQKKIDSICESEDKKDKIMKIKFITDLQEIGKLEIL